MKEKILNFLNEGKPLLWIKAQNFNEIENIIVEGLNAFENKRYYVYEKGTTINRQNNSVEVGMGNLFTTLDELYPQGIRKIPVFLLIKDSLAEIVDENNYTSYYIQADEITEAVGQLNLYSAPIVILFYNGKEIHRQARIIDFSELDYRIKQTL